MLEGFEFIELRDIMFAVWAWIAASFGWVTHKIQSKKIHKSYLKSIFPYIDEFIAGILITPLLVLVVPEIAYWYFVIYSKKMIEDQFQWHYAFSIVLGAVSYPFFTTLVAVVQIIKKRIENAVSTYAAGKKANGNKD